MEIKVGETYRMIVVTEEDHQTPVMLTLLDPKRQVFVGKGMLGTVESFNWSGMRGQNPAGFSVVVNFIAAPEKTPSKGARKKK